MWSHSTYFRAEFGSQDMSPGQCELFEIRPVLYHLTNLHSHVGDTSISECLPSFVGFLAFFAEFFNVFLYFGSVSSLLFLYMFYVFWSSSTFGVVLSFMWTKWSHLHYYFRARCVAFPHWRCPFPSAEQKKGFLFFLSPLALVGCEYYIITCLEFANYFRCWIGESCTASTVHSGN